MQTQFAAGTLPAQFGDSEVDGEVHLIKHTFVVYTVLRLRKPILDPMNKSPKTALFALALATAALSTLAPSVQAQSPKDGVRVTELTGDSHPFETLYCARQAVQVRFLGKLAEVVVDGESRILMQALSASGARYVAPGDDNTELWGKGALATLTWSGQQLPLCAPAGTIIPPYRASGNEPFWTVTYDGWSATLNRPGEVELTQAAVINETSGQGQSLVAGDGPDGWTLLTQDGLCIDNMSGMPHPQKVVLHYQSTTLHGCGGDPERLLQGVTWTITHIGDQPVNTPQPLNIRFDVDNRVHGSAGCNTFFGSYALSGESLSFVGIGQTRMACPPDQMASENALLSALSSVSRFSFDDTNTQTLRLHADQTEIRANASAD